MDSPLSRRRLLGLSASASLFTIAGCSSRNPQTSTKTRSQAPIIVTKLLEGGDAEPDCVIQSSDRIVEFSHSHGGSIETEDLFVTISEEQSFMQLSKCGLPETFGENTTVKVGVPTPSHIKLVSRVEGETNMVFADIEVTEKESTSN